MTNFSELSTISKRFEIGIPQTLINLLDEGLTHYPDGYNKNFISVSTTKPIALSSVYDFEWLGEDEATASVSDWLNPRYQNGARFLPFAQSGAGDQYCMVESKVGEGCGLIWHDDESSVLNFQTFEDFVCGAILDTMQDLTHLIDKGFSPEEAITFVRLDASQVLSNMPQHYADDFHDLLKRQPVLRPYKPAPKVPERDVLSFISQDEHDSILAKYMQKPPLFLPITAQWEIP